MIEYIALRHRTSDSVSVHIRIARDAQIEELATLAQPGDTMHKLPSELVTGDKRVSTQPIFDKLNEQLACGEFVKM